MPFPPYNSDQPMTRRLESVTFHSPTLPGAMRLAADWMEEHLKPHAGPYFYALRTEESTIGMFVTVIFYA